MTVPYETRLTRAVALDVADLDAAVDFYVSVLGMRVVARTASDAELAWGDAEVFLQQADDSATYLDVATSDLDATVDALRTAGCRLDPATTPEGVRSYLVTDRHGVRFHLFEKAGS